MTSITAAGYIIQDKQGVAIHGYGATVDEAWAMVVEGAGPFFDAYGNEISDDDAYLTKFQTYGATAELLAEVQQHGGEISWGMVNGVACTRAEEEA